MVLQLEMQTCFLLLQSNNCFEELELCPKIKIEHFVSDKYICLSFIVLLVPVVFLVKRISFFIQHHILLLLTK